MQGQSTLKNPHTSLYPTNFDPQICTRPFTVFQWKPDRTSRPKKTNICLTCARLKNCCQCCMLDLSFGLPIVVRDAALKMIAPGPQSAVNREFYAQEHEKEIEEGRGAVEEYEKTDEKARELLRRLANSQPYFKKQRRIEGGGENGEGSSSTALTKGGAGPIRTRDNRGGGDSSTSTRGSNRGGRGGGGGRGIVNGSRGPPRSFPSAAQLPPSALDILPPTDLTITSLFITGIEDDLPEHKIREFFTPFGKLRSLVCSHMSRCAFINFADREGAEKAAEKCQGKAVIAGCPLRVQWGRPRPIGMMNRDERAVAGREGRQAFSSSNNNEGRGRSGNAGGNGNASSAQTSARDEIASMSAVAPPPGADDIQYASLAGN